MAKVQAVAIAGFFFDQEFECQIYQIVRTPGVKVKNVGTPQYQSIAFTEYSFTPLLSSAATPLRPTIHTLSWEELHSGKADGL